MEIGLYSHIDKADAKYKEVSAIVDGILYQGRLYLSRYREVSSISIGLHHWENQPATEDQTCSLDIGIENILSDVAATRTMF